MQPAGRVSSAICASCRSGVLTVQEWINFYALFCLGLWRISSSAMLRAMELRIWTRSSGDMLGDCSSFESVERSRSTISRCDLACEGGGRGKVNFSMGEYSQADFSCWPSMSDARPMMLLPRMQKCAAKEQFAVAIRGIQNVTVVLLLWIGRL